MLYAVLGGFLGLGLVLVAASGILALTTYNAYHAAWLDKLHGRRSAKLAELRGLPPLPIHPIPSEDWLAAGDCEEAWSAWGPCSATCATGWRTRSSVVSRPASGSGKPCEETQRVLCNDQALPPSLRGRR